MLILFISDSRSWDLNSIQMMNYYNYHSSLSFADLEKVIHAYMSSDADDSFCASVEKITRKETHLTPSFTTLFAMDFRSDLKASPKAESSRLKAKHDCVFAVWPLKPEVTNISLPARCVLPNLWWKHTNWELNLQRISSSSLTCSPISCLQVTWLDLTGFLYM